MAMVSCPCPGLRGDGARERGTALRGPAPPGRGGPGAPLGPDSGGILLGKRSADAAAVSTPLVEERPRPEFLCFFIHLIIVFFSYTGHIHFEAILFCIFVHPGSAIWIIDLS